MEPPTARIIGRRPLRYRRGADLALDRPAHVRAASALVWLGDALIVVQDDALFVGIVEPDTGLVTDVPVPDADTRTFDTTRGNKLDKPDFESAIVIADELIAFGSGGSLPARRVILRWRHPGAPRLVAAPALFAALAAVATPTGELNLEGAAMLGDRVWLANRGGDHRDGAAPTRDRLIAILAVDLLAALDGGAVPPVPTAVVDVELGAIDGVDLHLSDLAVRIDATGSHLWCLASAEQTRSAFDDGEVVGSVIGRLGLDGRAQLARVVDAAGAPVADKLEGLAFDPAQPDRAYAVTDPDDPERPGELLELALG